MRRLLLTVCCFVAVARPSAAADDAQPPLTLTWQLHENLPDSHYRAELSLRNPAAVPLSRQWALYFNCSSRLLPERVQGPFELEPIHGDFYVLRPSEEFAPLRPGGETTLTLYGAPWALNASAAISGPYLVEHSDARTAGRRPVPVPLEIASFPAADALGRGGNDQVEVVTAESRFAENGDVSLLPPDQLPVVLPTPVEVQVGEARTWLDSSTTVLHAAALNHEAQYLAECLQQRFGQPVTVDQGQQAVPNTVMLRIGDVRVAGQPKGPGDEAYVLTTGPAAQVEIVGTDAAGVLYGIQSLRALLPVEADHGQATRLDIPVLRIEDAPRFAYRGLHLDVARNFQSAETVKKLLELMAFYKLNRFHWHLTDDEGWRVPIQELPELTEVGGRRGHTLDEADRLVPSFGSGPAIDRPPGSGHYTREEFVDIVRFAQRRHIEVIPEIDCPGHSRAAIVAMNARSRRLAEQGDRRAAIEFLLTHPDDNSRYRSIQGWRDNVMDVGQESTYRFVEVVVDELAAMFQEAGAPLACIHLGGDEVPAGAWEASPACRSLPADNESPWTWQQQRQRDFLSRACGIVAARGAVAACWEDCLLFAPSATEEAGVLASSEFPVRPVAYVWNNVWGWGREDAAYRLANRGYDVVLCNATNLYFDLAYEKHPAELGYYWAGFVGTRSAFEFQPLDVYQNAERTLMGEPIAVAQFADRVRLSDAGQSHILGLQGQLWGETLHEPTRVEYMAFPRVIALAERAWAPPPAWSQADDKATRDRRLAHDWNRFANALGQRDLPRLDRLAGGVGYRIPPPGAVVRDSLASANVALPGLAIRYTTDGSEPTASSAEYRRPVATEGELRFRTFDSRGRGSRTVVVDCSAEQRSDSPVGDR